MDQQIIKDFQQLDLAVNSFVFGFIVGCLFFGLVVAYAW